MSQAQRARERATWCKACANYLQRHLYPDETNKEDFADTERRLVAAFKILTHTSDTWLASPTFTSAVESQLMAIIKGATRQEQDTLHYILAHLLDYGYWFLRDEQWDNQLLASSGCHVTKLVWLFRAGAAMLSTKTSKNNLEAPAEMVTNLWESRARNINVQGEEQVYKQFAVDLKRWGRVVEHRNVTVDVSMHTVEKVV
jgi:hypothetical protein